MLLRVFTLWVYAVGVYTMGVERCLDEGLAKDSSANHEGIVSAVDEIDPDVDFVIFVTFEHAASVNGNL